MNGAEMLIMTTPFLGLAGAVFLRVRLSRSWVVPWLSLAAGCLFLSLLMIGKMSVLMGGGISWREVVYYGWFLFALFVLLRVCKQGLLVSLDPVSRLPVPRRLLPYLKKGLAFVLLFILAIPFFLAMTSIHRPKIKNIYNPQSTLGLAYHDVTLMTRDHLRIRGWFVPAKTPRAVIIAHGLGANKSNFIETVSMWNALGFNVLIFDFRGHGDSDGHTVSFGYRERYDVIAAMDYLVREKKFLPEHIWGYGVSFGGAAMLQAAAEDPRFRGLIIDSSFADFDQMAEKTVGQIAIIPPFSRRAIKEIGLFFIRLDLGVDLRRHSPLRAVPRLTGTPVLFIHGRGDPLIPWTQTEQLYQMAKGPKELYLIETSGHYATLADPRYMERIGAFIMNSDSPSDRASVAQ